MSRWKRKQQNRNWWDDEDDYYRSRYGDIFADPFGVADEGLALETARTKTKETIYHQGFSYDRYFYRQTYDMSIDLELRVKQLIKSISGKDLKLAKAEGWGSDDKYFYYNPQDLKDATDDEVLGIIFHQLGKELHYSSRQTANEIKKDEAYKHLLLTLEDNRADRQMQKQYGGAKYYADEIWGIRKYANKPEAQSVKPFPKEVYDFRRKDGSLDYDAFEKAQLAWQEKHAKVIPAEEFNYNLSAYQNGESEFSFHNKPIASDFKKALPHIEQYLEASGFREALTHLEAIKKYYPKPTADEQENMNQRMGAELGGLSQQEKERAKKQLQAEERANRPRNMESAFDNAYGSDLSEAEKKDTPDANRYHQEQIAQAGTIQSLHALLRSILQDNETARYQRPTKRGKIDGKNMYKLLATDNNRIFKRQLQPGKKHYAMSILVDQSGSMSGERIRSAFSTMVILTEVFHKLGIAFEVRGFDYHSRSYKPMFGAPRREVLGGIIHATGGGTNDHEAIKMIYEDLLKVDPSYKKTVFVVGDGDGRGEYVKSLVNQMEQKQIQVYGVGVGNVYEDSFRRTYNKWLVIPEPKDLPVALVNLVRDQFRRG